MSDLSTAFFQSPDYPSLTSGDLICQFDFDLKPEAAGVMFVTKSYKVLLPIKHNIQLQCIFPSVLHNLFVTDLIDVILFFAKQN